jgi:DNA-binding NtrC family response regulator
MPPKDVDYEGATAPIGELGASTRAAGLSVCVTLEGRSRTLPLPASGIVTIGRSRDAAVCIEHQSVSRRHAQLQIGSRLTVQDLGSQNGTLVRGAAVEPHSSVGVGLGDPIAIGVATLVVRELSDERPGQPPDEPRAGSGDLRGELRSVERERIRQALHDCGGNQTKAARLLGMSLRTLVSRITEYGLPRPKK